MAKDYYKVLGVNKNASPEEIKRAYRRLAHQFHPDKAGGDEKKFKEINEAYQILSDKRKREQYDQFGTAEPFRGFEGQNPFAGFDFSASNYSDLGDLGEIFDTFFEGLGVRPRRRTYHHGSDLEIQETITLEEAFRGLIKNMRIKTFVRCERCRGQGADPGAGFTTCSVCGGRGEIKEQKRTFFGSFSQVKVCGKCQGAGQAPNKVCASCKGSGRVMGEREVAVEFLPGIHNDQIIKVTGMGEVGERGAPSGDLYVRVRVKPHVHFERVNDDLIVEQGLNVYDLLLGRKIKITRIDGGFSHVEIPSQFNLKENLRIPGEGMPHFGSFGRGDLLVRFSLKTPKKVSAKAKKLLEAIESEES